MTVNPAALEITHVADPGTGEAICLETASLRELAVYLEDAREVEAQIRSAKRAVSIELHRRMDEQARWTLDADGYKLSGESPARVDYKPAKLFETLQDLVADGTISPEAAGAACERVYTYKAIARGVQAIKKLGGAAAKAIALTEVPVDPLTRSIKIRRKDWAGG